MLFYHAKPKMDHVLKEAVDESRKKYNARTTGHITMKGSTL